MKPDANTQSEIIRVTVDTVGNLLELATEFRVQTYILDAKASGFREFEDEVGQDDSGGRIKGIGLLTDRKSILIEKVYEDDYLIKGEVPLGSHELGHLINQFPLAAAAASYAFTVMEVYGDEVAELVSPGSVPSRQAWHRKIHDDVNLKDLPAVTKAITAFAEAFSAQGVDVPPVAVKRIINLKALRNRFAHKGTRNVDFEDFIADTIAIVCHIAFLTTDVKRLSVYGFEDHLDTFKPRTKA